MEPYPVLKKYWMLLAGCKEFSQLPFMPHNTHCAVAVVVLHRGERERERENVAEEEASNGEVHKEETSSFYIQ